MFLSPDFSSTNPSELLIELKKIAVVHIVYDIPFHSKVYLMESAKGHEVIFGSSNCTLGGIEENIEFDAIKQLDMDEYQKFKMFFDYCTSKSKVVNDEIIQSYKDSEVELEELRKIQQKIRSKLRIYQTASDPFGIDTYDLNGYFFNFDDYEIFFRKNERRKDGAAMARRKATQSKLLKIHNQIYPKIKTLGLNCHWKKEHITSLITPCEFNKERVSWMGIRYGKSHDEVKLLSTGRTENEFLGFQKHACIQFSIAERGLEVSLFHAVAKEAVDRKYLHDELIHKSKADAIINEIRRLQGNQLVWRIYDAVKQKVEAEFDLDNERAEEFINFYKQNDKDGFELALSYFVPAHDPSIQTMDDICNLVLEKTRLLLPLYKQMAYRFT